MYKRYRLKVIKFGYGTQLDAKDFFPSYNLIGKEAHMLHEKTVRRKGSINETTLFKTEGILFWWPHYD